MKIIERRELKPKPAAGTPLGFGKYFTDYMFTMRYTREKGWHDARVEPNEPVAFDLATCVFHYAQGVFEGMKAFRRADGTISVFRPDRNWERMNNSADRMCIPRFPAELAEEGLETLLRLERDWIPSEPETALYIRPAIVATRVMLGVHASTEYLFFILLSPVGSYYARGLQPTKLLVEEFYSRSSLGGTGEAKCLGNYAASIKSGEIAEEMGFDQVLWLDSAEKKYVEEAGSMNVFFVFRGEVATPALVGSILPGITRASCLQLLADAGYPVSERRITMEEVAQAAESGALSEMFGTGTAAVVSPVGAFRYRGKDHVVNGGKIGELTARLYATLTGIQRGALPDVHGWNKLLR